LEEGKTNWEGGKEKENKPKGIEISWLRGEAKEIMMVRW